MPHVAGRIAVGGQPNKMILNRDETRLAGRLAASYDIDRLRVASNLHAERVFAEGRDPIDILVLAGLSYRVMNEIRVGAEYVGQDLEEAFDNGAEGGPRHYLGPSLALNLMSDSIQLVAGAGMALQSRGSAPWGELGRS